MARIDWDLPGSRHFEYGVDRGVLYSPGFYGVPWNGLTSVSASPESSDPTPKYVDGIKVYDRPGNSEFSGTISAFTYPDLLDPHMGLIGFGNGLHLDDQRPKPFGLSYRTMRGNDLKTETLGYRIHLVYNVLIPSHSSTHGTTTGSVDISDFSWKFTTTPLSVDGYRHSAHVMIDSLTTNKLLLKTLEDRLYGKEGKNSYLPKPVELIDLFENYQPTGYGHGPFGHTKYGHGSEY